MADAEAVAAACRQSGRHCGERPALEVFRGRFKGRRTKIILTASQEHFGESRFASPKAILGQCRRTILPLPTTRADPAKKAPGVRGPPMKHAVQAGLRSSTSGGTQRTFLAALLTALGTIGAVSNTASAQTVFTLPASPFELPMVPSVSGNW